MSLFNVFDVSGTALTAQSQRLNTIASNLANAESVTTADGQPYRAKHVVFSSQPLSGADAVGVKVTGVVQDTSPLRRVHDPAHPLADDKGYVNLPNVNVVDEMVNMISASRSYQTNVELMNTAKTLLLKTLAIGQ
jgi:flagellar basal-body rod protein FlgC